MTPQPAGHNPIRALFFGTGDIGLPLFRWLLDPAPTPPPLPPDALLEWPAPTPAKTSSDHTPEFAPPAVPPPPPLHIAAAITAPPKPAGRGHQLRESPIALLAKEHGVPVLCPHTLRRPEALHTLRDLAPDLLIVMAYGKLLPPALLELPRLGAWNLHASLLPRHRGASPIAAAILAGDTHTGISVMRMVEALDAGPVLLKASLPIHPQETAGELHDRLAALTPAVWARAWPLIATGLPQPQPQPEPPATYCPKLEKHHGHLDWHQPADLLARRIRAVTPWPGAVAWLPPSRPNPAPIPLKIWRANPIPPGPSPSSAPAQPSPSHPGQILHASPHGIDVAAGGGTILRILECQLPGKKRLPAADFLRGHPLPPGLRFLQPPSG